ncbi:MAG TPA: VCBS repeat-containing protein [Vicinamibacterales bacterium]|nr:VCBS repeat-containing protein [Vicinamibacterales bacterium]
MTLSKGVPGLPALVCSLAIVATTSAGPAARTRALVPTPAVVTGTGAGLVPTVTVFDASTGQRGHKLNPFGDGPPAGVRLAVGDVNADGTPDIVAAAGPSASPIVTILDGADGSVLARFLAYDAAFQGGVFVALGDVNGDGHADVITGAGESGSPHVKVFSGADLSVLYSFFAYAPQMTAGVRVAAGDVDGDGLADIITAPGPGAAPLINAFSGSGLVSLASFFAYAPQFTDGVFVAAGDVDGDGAADIITGGGASRNAVPVKVISASAGGVRVIASFFAYGADSADGVTVAAADVNGDNQSDIVTGPQRGAPLVKVFDGRDASVLSSFFAYNPHIGSGVYVGAAPARGAHR